jgi:hypothetical protein
VQTTLRRWYSDTPRLSLPPRLQALAPGSRPNPTCRGHTRVERGGAIFATRVIGASAPEMVLIRMGDAARLTREMRESGRHNFRHVARSHPQRRRYEMLPLAQRSAHRAPAPCGAGFTELRLLPLAHRAASGANGFQRAGQTVAKLPTAE